MFKPEGRAAIYISKQFEIGQWDFEASENRCRVWFPEVNLGQGGQGQRGQGQGQRGRGLELWSIYNPPSSKEVPGALLSRPKPAYPVILAGDFNLHHPLWDEFGRYERKAEDLL